MRDDTPAQPTQARYPGRATIRTVLAAIVGLAFLLPVIADTLGAASVPWVAGAIAVTGGVTRVLAIPAVNEWLQEYIPGLAAAPRGDDQ